MSGVRCQESGIRYHVSFFFYNVVELVGGGSVFNRAQTWKKTFFLRSEILGILIWQIKTRKLQKKFNCDKAA